MEVFGGEEYSIRGIMRIKVPTERLMLSGGLYIGVEDPEPRVRISRCERMGRG